ncbi:hypothetical protein BC941DRAFT_433559 [Chlamydoabsidia padenii]|nr:hypothetical protein BC941DRAFT_433559 [Chlamydoabsidia padenii]
MSYPHHHQHQQHQHHQMLPQQQDFLNSLNSHQQSFHQQSQYPNLLSPQQTGKKRKDMNDYMIDGTMAGPMKKPKKKKKTKTKEPEDPNAPPKPKRNTGLNKPLILSAALSALMDGEPELSRPEIVKRLWKYIKGNDLQDPKDRRYILCDEKLRAIFHVDRVNSFGMNRDLSQHLTKKEEGTEGQQSLSTTTLTTETVPIAVPTATSSEPSSTSSSSTSSSSSSSSVLLPTPVTEDASIISNMAIKQSPTVTADTPDDVVTPQEGEHVHALTNNNSNSNSNINNIINNNSSITPGSSNHISLSTPILH